MLVLLSPFEVNLLLPDIRASKHVHLHLYSPRTFQRRKPSDDLKLYVIPSLRLDSLLGIFTRDDDEQRGKKSRHIGWVKN